MINPRYQRDRLPNGRFWCSHKWLLIERVPLEWYVCYAPAHLCRCTKCGKEKHRKVWLDYEVPDEMITDQLHYW